MTQQPGRRPQLEVVFGETRVTALAPDSTGEQVEGGRGIMFAALLLVWGWVEALAAGAGDTAAADRSRTRRNSCWQVLGSRLLAPPHVLLLKAIYVLTPRGRGGPMPATVAVKTLLWPVEGLREHQDIWWWRCRASRV